MSAYVVHPEHIRVLVWAGIHFTHPGSDLTWYVPNPEEVIYQEGVKTQFGRTYRQLNRRTAETVGQLLLDENVRSVNYRYDEGETYIYKHDKPVHTNWSPVEVLSAIACYEYQACETPEWQYSEARTFCDALRSALVAKLPGYDKAPWGIGPETLPAAKQPSSTPIF